MIHRNEPRAMASVSRRGFLFALAAATAFGSGLDSGLGRAQAGEWAPTADGERTVAVPHVAFGTIVAAIVDRDLALVVDPELPFDSMRLGETTVDLGDRLLLKGSGDVRGRYLDDARNAPKLGAAVRDRLRAHWPELGSAFARRHKTWSHALVRNILRWTQALDRSGLRGKRVRDPHGFIYLLEWAGAEVAADGSEPPAGLQSAPRQPAAATPEAYVEYVQALVDALR